MAAISPNLIAAEPSIDAIADALCEAAGAADDVDRRLRGSRVDWSRDWAYSFDDPLMARVEALLWR
jgi:hypothetical protein